MHHRYANVVITASKVRNQQLVARLLRVAEALASFEELNAIKQRMDTLGEELKPLSLAYRKHKSKGTAASEEAIALKSKLDELFPEYEKSVAAWDAHKDAWFAAWKQHKKNA